MKTQSNKPRILVFEPYALGHRLNYARIVLDAVHSLAGTVIFCTQESTLHSKEFGVHFARLPIEVEVETFPTAEGTSMLKTNLHFARNYQAAVRRHRPDYIYVPSADGLIQSIGWFRLLTGNWRKTPQAEMLVMRGHSYLGCNGGWFQALKRWFAVTGIRASGCKKLHALDEKLFDLLTNCRLGGIELHSMPEVRNFIDIPNKSLARERFSLNPNDLVVGFFGRRSSRKGFHLLLQAFARVKHPQVKLLVLGQSDNCVDELEDRIISHDTYVSSEELLLGMTATDVICIPYPEHDGSSGFLADAAATGNMILASNYGWIGETVTNYELGMVCDVRNPDAFHSALEQSLRECQYFQHSAAADRFLEKSCRKNILTQWTAGLSVYLGRAQDVEA